MPNWLRSFFLNKLVLRIAYISAAYLSSHAVSLLAMPKVQGMIDNYGLQISISNPEKLRASIMVSLMMFGECVFHFFHTKFILPHVNKNIGG